MRKGEKFPTIYKSIDLFRGKVEAKESGKKIDELPNQISSKWPNVLRKEVCVEEMNPKQAIAKTFHDDGVFLTRGKSKFRQEEEWLTRKS